jgi:uncharacterized protein (TIGR03083 family)
MIDFLSHVRSDADRIAAVAELGMGAAVPSCPGWTVRDLVAHTGVVYAHKTTIVRDGWVEEQPEPIEPPSSGELEWFCGVTDEMLDVLAAADPATEVATWHAPDQSVGFWRRRMAHESVIHRLDAELAHRVVTPVDPVLGADGIDEILVVMLSGAPDWSDTTYGEQIIAVAESDGGRTWRLRVGDFTGTSPGGHVYDREPAFFVDDTDTAPTTLIAGRAGVLDGWLWGRAAIDELTIEGDAGLADLLRAIAAEVTQ